MGTRLIPLLIDAGHDVVALTKREEAVDPLAELGATPVVGNVLDAAAIASLIDEHQPDVVMHQVTALPDRMALLPLKVAALNKVRTTGTANLVAPAVVCGATVIAQSVAFPLPAIAQRAVDSLEKQVLGAKGVVIRYGLFYGPGTWHDKPPAKGPVVHVDEAARRTVELLTEPSGVVTVAEDR